MSDHQQPREKLTTDEAAAAEDVSKTVYGQPVIMSQSVMMGQPPTTNQSVTGPSAKKYETAEEP